MRGRNGISSAGPSIPSIPSPPPNREGRTPFNFSALPCSWVLLCPAADVSNPSLDFLEAYRRASTIGLSNAGKPQKWGSHKASVCTCPGASRCTGCTCQAPTSLMACRHTWCPFASSTPTPKILKFRLLQLPRRTKPPTLYVCLSGRTWNTIYKPRFIFWETGQPEIPVN